jgi:hypothetical protein
MNQKLWEGPVEKFYWNGRLSIRDAKKRVIFYLDIDTREYWAVKRLMEGIAPKLVEMMNQADQPQAFADEVLAAAGIASVSSEDAPSLPKRRGRPPRS